LFGGLLITSVALQQVMIRFPLVAHEVLWRDFLFMWLPTQAPVFALGIVLYFLWQKVEALDPQFAAWFIASGVFLAGAACFGGYSFLPGHVVFGIAFVLLALGLSMKNSLFWVNPMTRALGQVSYSFYLTHLLVLPLCARAFAQFSGNPPPLLHYAILWMVGGALSYAVASKCYRFVEKPGMELGRRWIEKSER
jgi:peptidoglycan/LPS O-acetylase OafA/YrhL